MEIYFPLFLDGATGTQLQKRGYDNSVCSEEWVLMHPEMMHEIQRNYIDAGSNVIYAPTFGANRVKLEENGIFNQVADYNRRLVEISQQAAQGRALVCGDIAPTGKFLAPLGDMSFDEMVEVYTEQAAALEQAGVDLYAIETTMTLPEARAAVLAVKSVSEKPVIVTFTCDESGKTLTGTDVVAALVVMQGMGVDAFGLNCSVGPEKMFAQLRRLHEYAEVPLICKPHAGMPELEDGKTVYRCTPQEFAEAVPALVDAGVTIFGGCCGTEPEHIAALKRAAAAGEMKRPQPLHPELLPLATEKNAFLLPPNTPCGEILTADESLSDAIETAEDSADTLLSIRIENEEQLENFSDCQYAVSKPLCLLCDDVTLLEQALRAYQGRAMYEGALTEKELLPLARTYGLVF